MKRIACLVLGIALLLTLCACGSKEPAVPMPTDRVDPEPTVTPIPQNPTTEPSQAPQEPTTGFAKPAPVEVTVYDDPQYGKVMLDAVFTGPEYQVGIFTVTNTSDSVMYFNVAQTVYVNDVMMSPVALREENEATFHANHGMKSFYYDVEVAPGQSEELIRVISDAAHDEAVMEFSVKIRYDNGEIGAYHQQIELMNELFRFQTTEAEASDKYIASGSEPFAVETETYRMVLTDWGETQVITQDRYWFLLYLENTTDEKLTFEMIKELENMANVSSDQQNRVDYVNVWLNCDNKSVTLAPGKGFYLLAEMPKEDVDGFAKDASEVITLHVPFTVYDGDDSWSCTWQDTQEVQLLRDTLVNGIGEVNPTTEPMEPATEPTEPATEPTEPATEPTESATEPTEPNDMVVSGDPGDIGHGGAPESNHTHAYNVGGIRNPTCVNPGYTAYVCYCGDMYFGDRTEPTGHDYEVTVVAPTEESEGYTEYYCWKCGDRYREKTTDEPSA